MKKLLSFLFIVCTVFALLQAEKTVAVATFEVVGDTVKKGEAEVITELYIAELQETGKIAVVDRSKFTKAFTELNFQESDWSNASKTAKLGNAVNAELLSRGKIMRLGYRLYITVSLIDAKTAKVLSTKKSEIRNVDNIPSILSVFVSELTSIYAHLPHQETKKVYIGMRGPAGGMVFRIEEGRAWEVSEILGGANWEGAKTMCENYRGGGFSDWYLPNKEELNWIYKNLVKTGKIEDENCYWSSSQASNYKYYAWCQDFDGGKQDDDYKSFTRNVRAVRIF